MLIGEYIQKVTNSRRLALPSLIRSELKGDLYITRGYEKSLVIVDENLWENMTKDIRNGSIINNLIRDTSRMLIGGARQISLDTQGRFVVPDNLFGYANISNEVVFVGLINWVEIWDIKEWKKKTEYLEKNSEKIADELNKQLRSNE